MTSTTDHHDYEPTREDVLIGRVVDHEATPSDWQRLDEIAGGDPGVWARLGRAQRAHARLRIAVDDAIAGAELVEIPDGRAHKPGRRSVAARLAGVGGWAIAAALGLALLGPALDRADRNGLSAGMQNAGVTLLSQASPEEAYTQYVASGLASGSVVSEMPTLVLEERPLPDGTGSEVYVVRRVVERVTVNGLSHYTFAPDEFGQLRLTPVTGALSLPSGVPAPPASPSAPQTMDF